MCSEESGSGYAPFKQGSGLRDWKMCDFQLRAEERASWTRLRQMTFSYRGAQTIRRMGTSEGPLQDHRRGMDACFVFVGLGFVLSYFSSVREFYVVFISM